MDWVTIIEAITTAIVTVMQNCPKETDKAKLAYLKSPGPLHWLRLNMQLRDQGLSANDRKAAVEAAKQMSKDATDDDRKRLLALSKKAA
jgi:hypothetical protein